MNKPDADFYPASDQDYFEDLQKWRESQEMYFTLPIVTTDVLVENCDGHFKIHYKNNVGNSSFITVQSEHNYSLVSQGKSPNGIHVTLQPV